MGDRAQEIRQRLTAATKGPWRQAVKAIYAGQTQIGTFKGKGNGALAANAFTDLEWCLGGD